MAEVVLTGRDALASRALYSCHPQIPISKSIRAIRISRRGLAFKRKVNHGSASSLGASGEAEARAIELARADGGAEARPESGAWHF